MRGGDIDVPRTGNDAASRTTYYVATPFTARTHNFVDASIFSKLASLDLSHGTNLLPPPLRFQEAIAQAAAWNTNATSIAQYGSPIGWHSLRELVAEYESVIYGDKVGVDNVLITLGGTDGLALYFLCRARKIANQAKPTVLLVGAQYPTIARVAEAAGFTVAMTLCSDDSCIHAVSAITEWKPDVVVVTQPSNPPGTFISDVDFDKLCSACAHVDADIVVDRVCGDIESVYYQPSLKYRLIAKKNGVPITEIESYSKRRSIPGLRIGYNIMSVDDVTWCSNAVTGRTITSVGGIAVECDIRAILDNDKEYIRHIAENHAIIHRNFNMLKDALGSKLVSYTKPVNGANFMMAVQLPRPMLESFATLWLYTDYDLGSYPVSCFELWPESEESDVMRIRITAATPSVEFDKAISILMAALSEQ
jgi:aspartate/methionine/tyrosine aminotransferase